MHACWCVLWLRLSLFVRACISPLKSMAEHWRPHLRARQLAPIISQSKAHQWIPNEAFLGGIASPHGMKNTHHAPKATQPPQVLKNAKMLRAVDAADSPTTLWMQIWPRTVRFSWTIQGRGQRDTLDTRHWGAEITFRGIGWEKGCA